MSRLLVVDDEKNMRELLRDVLAGEKHSVVLAEDGERALDILARESFDAAVVDMNLPGLSGMEILRRTRSRIPPLPVILITAFGSVDVAVGAMQLGAFNFILKPFDNDRITQTVKKCLESTDLLSKVNLSGPQFQDAQGKTIQIVGEDQQLQMVFEMVQKIAQTDASALIRGESGTGKELVAQAIHYNGPRKDGPFIAMNCSALPETLLESEFFGFEKGAFTGAHSVKRGKFELADGGTIFLDEIGDMPMSTQVKLLRVLQEHVFMRLGGEKEMQSDVRVIAATNRDLEAAVSSGEFREDLYFRLNVVPITLPPLRDRRGDIPNLVEFFSRRSAMKNRVPQLKIDEETMRRIQSYEWRGNIRELENGIERATILGDPSLVAPSNLPALAAGGRAGDISDDLPAGVITLAEATSLAQREAIKRALRKSGGNKLEAAKILGISNKTLYNKINDLGITLSFEVN